MKTIIRLLPGCAGWLPRVGSFVLIVWCMMVPPVVARHVRELLRADGTLNLRTGFSGSLDVSGFGVELDAVRGPVFRATPPSLLGWSALDQGLAAGYPGIYALAVIGTDLYVGGKITGVGQGGTPATGLNNIAKWNGTAWSALGQGLNGDVYALAVSGTNLYVGGSFTGVGAGGTPVTGLNNIARWDGSSWSALGSGLDGTVSALAASGADVYAGGSFAGVGAGGTPVTGLNKVARWNGTAWSALDRGLNGNTLALAVIGSDLYAGGSFTGVGSGGTPATGLNYIAKWNGTAWSALGQGLAGLAGGALGFDGTVLALAVSGSDLYVGGAFAGVGGGTAVPGLRAIGKWNGTAWSALGVGLDYRVYAIAVIGSDVYAAGYLTQLGDGTFVRGLKNIAKWNGTTWSPLDGGLGGDIQALAVIGTDLYAGGAFFGVGSYGTPVSGLRYVARWNSLTPVPPILTVGTATGSITACQGTASVAPAVRSFAVSGSNLTADLVATAPTGFEISTASGSGFGSSVSLPQSGGSVASTTLYVRSAATATSTISGNVTLASTGATTQNVAVSGTITASSPDYQPLVDLYNAANGPGWTNKTGWLTGCTPCGWYGVTCNGSGRVIALSLNSNRLSGTIPASLSVLTELQTLSLFGNQLSGSIPASLSALTNLRDINLSSNQLTGSLPASLGALTNLTSINLNFNQLSGSLPASLSALTNLTTIALGSNQLSGSIPASLSVLTNLTFLRLNANQLSGTIPASLSALTNLTFLLLDNNQLSGTIPASLSALTSLRSLDLYFNQLTGTIPASLSALTNLTNLDLRSNQLSGSIPAGLGALTRLTGLNLSNNQLTGSIPASLGALTNLTGLFLINNQLSGCYAAGLSGLCRVTNKFFTSNAGLPGGGSEAGFAAFCATGLSSNLAVSITGTPSLLLAPGGSIQLTASGADTYRWSIGQTSNPVTVSLAGPYSVTGTTTAGCSNTATVTVGVLPPAALFMVASASPATILTTGTTTLSASASGGKAPYSYSFSGPGTVVQTGNTATVSGLPVGVQSFTVVVADADLTLNQKVSQVVSVTVTPVPVVVASLSLTASASPITILTSGTTTLLASASGGTAPYSYSFNGPGTITQTGNTATVSGLSVGVQTFSVVARDAASPVSQSISQTVSVTVNAVPVVVLPPTALSLTASASPTTILTSGTTTLSASASGGTSPYSYSFSGPGTISQSGNTATVSGLPVGGQSFTVSVRDATAPTNQVVSQVVSVTVTAVPVVVPPPTALSLTASASPTTIFTNGTTTLLASASGGTAPYSYSFSGPGTISQSGNTATVSGLPVGVQTFTVSVRDAGSPTNQVVSQVVSVTVTPVPVVVTSLSLTASASPTTILASGSATLSASASGGTAPYSYSFSGPGTISQSGNAATVSGLPVGVQTFIVSVRDATAPTNQLLSQIVSVTVTPVPTVPPVPVPFSATVVSYNCATGELVLGSVGSASGGVAVEYAIPGITNFTSTNTFTLNAGLRRDASQLTISVRQGGVSGASFVFNLRAFCTGGGQPTPTPTPTPPAPVPTGGLSATVVSYNCATGALVLGSAGGTGSAVSYAIPGVTNFTPTNVFTLNDGLRRDASQLTINVQQGGVAGTPFVFNLRSFCQSQASARLGVAAEPVSELTVRVLGNPASGEAVVEIRGAEGQALGLRLADMSGRLLESRQVPVAGAIERQRFDLSHQAPGVLLLQVTCGGELKTVKIVRQ